MTPAQRMRRELRRDAIDVLFFALDRPSTGRSLSGAERARAAALAPGVRERFVAGRQGLREILGSYLGVSAQDVSLIDDPNGKPLLAGGELSFNLSHSDDLALVAVATAEVGADVETCRALADLDALAARVSSRDELRALHAEGPAARLDAFYRLWTRKEAYLKARGDGLRIEPSRVHVGCGPDPEPVRLDGAVQLHWSVQDVAAPSGFAAAVAVAASHASLCYPGSL